VPRPVPLILDEKVHFLLDGSASNVEAPVEDRVEIVDETRGAARHAAFVEFRSRAPSEAACRRGRRIRKPKRPVVEMAHTRTREAR